MIIPDRLKVTAHGANRDEVLKHADAQAATYFGGAKHRRVSAAAEVADATLDGSYKTYEAEVEYELVIER